MTQPSEPHAAKRQDAKSKSKPKPKPKSKPKAPSNTLDRWFKPSSAAAPPKKESDAPKEPPATVNKEETQPEKKKKKSGNEARKFVQRYIHITDACRVCESAKTDEATRCELRCATCSLTVHKKCYEVKGELPDGDWNCRRCQFLYDETAWEDVSALVGVASPEGVTFPQCKPLHGQKLSALQTNADFAAVFLFLQRFRRLGLKLSNVVTTLESLADALLEPKEDGLCEELHARLLSNINVVMGKKYGWYVHLLRFLREAEYPPAIGEDTTYPASSSETCEEYYFELSVAERVAILKFLCEIQFDRNDALIELIDNEEADSMRNEPIGMDAAGRSYFVLEDAATVPNAAVWVCRCTKVGGTDWETVCNDLESVEFLVQELALSVESPDLQLWQTLSRGALKKLTRQKERRKRNERWKNDLAANQVLDSSVDYGIGRRSLRNRKQVNYSNVDTEEDEEETVADSDDEGDEEEASDAKSGDEADSETDGDGDEDDENQPRRSSRNGAVTNKRKAQDRPTHSKRIRHSPHEDATGLRRSTRTRGNATNVTTSSDSDDSD